MENFKHLVKPFEKIINAVTLAGGRFIFVGGSVRDILLEETPKDVDAEVYGIPFSKLKQALELIDSVSEVGKQFGVLKLKNYPIDISLPRFDTKTGAGHKGFSVKVDYSISFKQAAKRRDLTINAMGFDPIKNEILDPYGGMEDLNNHILRPVDPQTFIEDPLRGLRVAQLASRFLMEPHNELIALCQTLNIRELPHERIFEELKKLLVKGKKPSKGLVFLKKSNLLHQIFLPLAELEETRWKKTLDSLDDAALFKIENPEKKLVLMLGLLCFYLSHLETENFLKQCIIKDKIKERICVTLENGRILLENKKVNHRADLFWIGTRLHKKGTCWHDLIIFLKLVAPKASWVTQLSQKIFEVGASHPKNLEPIVTGEHLIKKGLLPGKEFNDLLKKCLKIQYEQGITRADEILEKIL